ncbi:hypothetical protein OSB04_001857 [Centaurea solstitialis]|uniref:F-box domain-containing protein n=1 Tax=Centaurea solstitialis TaxID=347529 RepID=A0AA38U4E4_9ASTR|nr:hypothetical protein OSB04_001857 [Centaurea solstitialis]
MDIRRRAMKEKRDWLQMPDEIMGGMILQRLNAVQILISAQKVCKNWRRICKDPAMWKVINLDRQFYFFYTKSEFENLAKQAVRRSRGELIDISLKDFGTDELLHHISRCSSKLNCLRLEDCDDITPCGLSNALKRLPHLETLELYAFHIPKEEDIELIGRNCPLLKSFEMKPMCAGGDVYARAIAKSMPALRHLKLFGLMDDNNGVQAILNGCPHLESLDLRGCPYHDLDLDENLEKLCRERIIDFKYNISESEEDSDTDW